MGIRLTHISCKPQLCSMRICSIYIWGWSAQLECRVHWAKQRVISPGGQISPRIVLLFDHDTPPAAVCHRDKSQNVMSEWFLKITFAVVDMYHNQSMAYWRTTSFCICPYLLSQENAEKNNKEKGSSCSTRSSATNADSRLRRQTSEDDFFRI